MKTLLINFNNIDDERIVEQMKSIDVTCIVADEFDFTKRSDEFDKVYIMYNMESTNSSELAKVVNYAELHGKENLYVIINLSNVTEFEAEILEDVIELIFSYVDGIVVEDKENLNEFVFKTLNS